MNRELLKSYAAKMGSEVTPEEAEAEIVRIMQTVARALAPAYRFGYHSVADIEQEGVYYAILALEHGRYDVSRPLENFLYVHMRNRMSNAKRDKYTRAEPPCSCCPPFSPPAFPCQKWTDWSRRNTAKKNLMRPIDVCNVADEHESNMRERAEVENDAVGNELHLLLDRELSVDLRKDYLQMLEGKAVPKARRQKVREAVIAIIREKADDQTQ